MTHNITTQEPKFEDSSLHRLFVAIFSGDYSIVQDFIASGFDFNCFHPLSGCTPLIQAVHLRHNMLVYDIVNAGGDVNLKERCYGETPLIAATKSSNGILVRFLIDHGAKLDAVDNLGNTALILAAKNSSGDIFSHLLSSGASFDLKTLSCETVITLLLEGGAVRTRCLLLLLKKKKIDIEKRNDLGQTALMIAANAKNFDGVISLVDHGADVLALDKKGNLAVEYMHDCYLTDRCKPLYQKFVSVSIDRLLREWTMTLFPLGLPVYVMLWIFEKNEPVASADTINEFKRISRIRGVVDSMRRIQSQKLQ